MSWKSQEPIVQVLQAVGNPIRKVAIESLRKGRMRFSQLLASCGLNYDHDTGHFYYHLSELMDKRIVKKVGDAYHLTEFGQKVARILDSLEKECSFLFLEGNRGEEPRSERSLKTEWTGDGSECLFFKGITDAWVVVGSERTEFKGIYHGQKAENGSTEMRFYGEDSSMQKAITESLPDGPEKTRLINFLEWFKRWKGTATLLVKEKDKPIGWAKIDHSISWGTTETDGKFYAKALVIIKDMIVTFVEDRREVASALLYGLLEKSQQIGADSILLVSVDSEDSAVIEAFRGSGFDRFGTSYTMVRKLLDDGKVKS